MHFQGVKIPRLAVIFVVTTVSLLLACFAFLTFRPVSAAPTTMNFQGRIADASGNIMPNGSYNMQFRLFTVASGGSATWTETRETTNRVVVTNGLFSVQLGSVTPLAASLFSGNDVYFEITLPTPGTATCGTASCASWESPMTPRHKMATSAYAFQAENANTLDGLDSTAFAQLSSNNTFTGTNTVSLTSATAFQVQNASTVAALTADTSNLRVQIGSSTTDSTAVLFLLDQYDQATDPANTINGAMYYNTDSNKIRCYQNSAWNDCIGTGGGGVATDLSNLTTTVVNQSLVAGTTNTIDIGSSSTTWRNGYFGTSINTPAIRPLVDSTAAFQLQNAAGAAILTVNATSNSIMIGGKVMETVSAGGNHTCGIATDKQAYCWGNNTYGQTGKGTTSGNVLSPIAVVTSGVLNGKTVLDLSSGVGYHTCAVASDNLAYCWGRDAEGQLGNGAATSTSQGSPVAVDTSGVLSGKTILSVSSGYSHTCAIANDNQVYCWGSDASGQLGNGATSGTQTSPVAVDTSGVLSGKTILKISAGTNHTCVVASDNLAYCWGGDANGQLGNGATSGDQVSPVAVDTSGVLSGKTIASISTGSGHTCAIASDNLAYCWGVDLDGQLGNGAASGNQVSPVAVDTSGVLSGKTILSISAEYLNTCAIASDNLAYCWGSDTEGQLGNGATSGDQVSPVAVDVSGELSGKSILSISSGDTHTCALATDGSAYCWGGDTYGELGNGATTGTEVSPVAVDTTGSLTANPITLSAAGIVLSGSARPTEYMAIKPEYTGATFTADGSNNSGSLSSDFCGYSTAGLINSAKCGSMLQQSYYQWTTTEATAQDYDVFVRFRMPDNIDTVSNFTVGGFVTSTTTDSVEVSIFLEDTQCGSTVDAATINGDWSTADLTSTVDGCLYGGDDVTIQIKLTAGQNNFALAGDILMTYKANR